MSMHLAVPDVTLSKILLILRTGNLSFLKRISAFSTTLKCLESLDSLDYEPA